ncbi:unnamed protein product [marine sediment metagenome]|uniref:Holin n=1 Tax=marine sediment metagenome TaxID=412755 RepID=X0UU56_9ZZZZ
MQGWKTWAGAALLGITALIGGLEAVVDPQTLLIWKAATGSLGAFFTAVGIGHKIEKIKEP